MEGQIRQENNMEGVFKEMEKGCGRNHTIATDEDQSVEYTSNLRRNHLGNSVCFGSEELVVSIDLRRELSTHFDFILEYVAKVLGLKETGRDHGKDKEGRIIE